MDNYSKYIFKSRYARYLPEEQRRETWEETVTRYITFFQNKHPEANIPWKKLHTAIHDFEVMPSMRAFMTAGTALDRDNVAGYNCSFVAIDNQRCFDEILYILMCGTGVGFSVERQFIANLPEIAEDFHPTETTIIVPDSKIGWAKSLRELITLLYNGQIPKWDLTRLRPAGAPLKTFGGRSSGPEPLDQLFKFVELQFIRAKGRKLNSLEVHDIVCKIAEVVVCGGVRRSALISLSNLSDERMRDAKSGEWYFAEPQRALANNSVCYTELPDMGIFMQEWMSLYKSKAGERGIFSRKASQRMAPERRDSSYDFGTNPCSEIVLRSKQFCNLTEVVVRAEDTEKDIQRKIGLATILGTLQATLTDFRYLSSAWKKNTAEEALLGVSLTGIMDNKMTAKTCMTDATFLNRAKETSVKVNKKYATILGIEQAAAITCVKPSGTVSQLVNSASGIHPRYAPYYIRRVRNDANDPLAAKLIETGVPYEYSAQNSNEVIFSFPIKSPESSITVDDITAIQQLEHWKVYATQYCEHKPSVSIYVKEDEWMHVGAWVYANWDIMNGVSFFPSDDHIYPQAPYEKIDKETFERMTAEMPDIADALDEVVEVSDETEGSQTLACHAGSCEL